MNKIQNSKIQKRTYMYNNYQCFGLEAIKEVGSLSVEKGILQLMPVDTANTLIMGEQSGSQRAAVTVTGSDRC